MIEVRPSFKIGLEVLDLRDEGAYMLAKIKQLRVALSLRALQKDQRGQDMIEYALLAAAIVVIVAGILPTQLMPMVSTIFSKIVGAFAKTPS